VKIDTVATAFAQARHKLTSDTSALDARLLMQAATDLSHAEVIAEPNRAMTKAQIEIFEGFIERRLAHEPVSRILGAREFYGRSFKISPAVLDPRADTECVVELAMKLTPRGQFIDLGTGSGAIAITLCAENSNLTGVASDLSTNALAVAKHNAETLGVSNQLRFHHGAWLEGIQNRFDLIISNPPYIKQDDQLPPDVTSYDPHLALFGGLDGLDSYRSIAAQSASHLTLNGTVVVEIGLEQADNVVEIFAANGFQLVTKAFDIAQHIRGLAFRSE